MGHRELSLISRSIRLPLVSIIVVNYNGEKFIEQCISSILKSKYPFFELIVIDNASTDKSREILQEKFGDDNRLRIIINKTNVGFAEANNIGVAKSRGKYLAFVNNDTEVDPYWLSELIRVAESDLTIGACQSKLVIMGTDLLDGTGDFITENGISFIRSHRIRNSPDHINAEIFSARAAAMLVRKKIFTAVGGFDPDYFIGYEDVDLGWRIRLLGYKVVFVPTSIVYHIGRASTSRKRDLESFHVHKNCMMTLIKNYGLINVLLRLPANMMLRLCLSLSPFEETRDISAVGLTGIKAILWVLLKFPEIWEKHMWVQSNIRKVSERQIKQLMLDSRFEVDLLRYFLFLRKKYKFWPYLSQLIDIHQKHLSLKVIE